MSDEKFASLKSDGWGCFQANDDPICPHCGATFSVSENEAYELYSDIDSHEVKCNECSDTFKVTTHVTYSFSTDDQSDE